MTVVVDASVVVAALVDNTALGRWAEEVIQGRNLVAPSLLPFEVANILRRLSAAGHFSADVAALAHRDLLRMNIQLVDYEAVADRVWALRDNFTCYDASFVALAEILDAPVATLDQKMAKAPGTSCEFLLPPKSVL